MHKIILILLLSVIVSCNDSGLNYVLSDIEQDFSHIENPKERWEAYKLKDYYIEQSWACECIAYGTVKSYIVSDEVVEVKLGDIKKSKRDDLARTYSTQDYKNAKEASMTVDQAFKLIEEHKETAHFIRVNYHPKYGYPTELYIDYAEMIADEETHYMFQNLQKLFY